MANEATPLPFRSIPPVADPGQRLDLQRLVKEAFAQIPGVVGVGFVDLAQGEFVALETIGPHPQDFLAYLAAATKTYFEGDSVRTIQAVLEEASGEHADRKIEEVIVRSARFIHVFQRLARDPRLVLSVVAERNTKIGLVQAVIRRLLAGE